MNKVTNSYLTSAELKKKKIEVLYPVTYHPHLQPAEARVVLCCSFPSPAPVSGGLGGRDFHQYPPGTVGASGGELVGSAHLTHSC